MDTARNTCCDVSRGFVSIPPALSELVPDDGLSCVDLYRSKAQEKHSKTSKVGRNVKVTIQNST